VSPDARVERLVKQQALLAKRDAGCLHQHLCAQRPGRVVLVADV
jgi:hypothetical protein